MQIEHENLLMLYTPTNVMDMHVSFVSSLTVTVVMSKQCILRNFFSKDNICNKN